VIIMAGFAITYRLLGYGVLCFKLLRRRQWWQM
jgi:hypothetical protein